MRVITIGQSFSELMQMFALPAYKNRGADLAVSLQMGINDITGKAGYDIQIPDGWVELPYKSKFINLGIKGPESFISTPTQGYALIATDYVTPTPSMTNAPPQTLITAEQLADRLGPDPVIKDETNLRYDPVVAANNSKINPWLLSG